MLDLEWSPDAVDDLDFIWDNIAQDDVDAADVFIDRLREEARFRCLKITEYVTFYRVGSNEPTFFIKGFIG